VEARSKKYEIPNPPPPPPAALDLHQARDLLRGSRTQIAGARRGGRTKMVGNEEGREIVEEEEGRRRRRRKGHGHGEGVRGARLQRRQYDMYDV